MRDAKWDGCGPALEPMSALLFFSARLISSAALAATTPHPRNSASSASA